MPPPRAAVLFRTYRWDDFAFRSALGVLRHSEAADFYVLADESGGDPFDVGPFAKLNHCEADFAKLGLPHGNRARKMLWWNCDYGFYDALLKRPDYEFYMFIEDDVAVNLPLMPIIERMKANGCEAILTAAPRTLDGWSHAWSLGGAAFERPAWAPLSAVAFSWRVLHLLLMERYRAAEAFKDGLTQNWPFCEGFVASTLMSRNVPLAGLREFAEMEHFGSVRTYLETDPRVRVPGSMAHSVLNAARFAEKVLGRTYNRALYSANYRELQSARERMLQAGVLSCGDWRIRPSGGNLALDKPAAQSSVSRYSRQMSAGAGVSAAEGDARGANTGVLTRGAGFHTDKQHNPWWQVDLQETARIAEVRMFNRCVCPERARHLSILTSDDAESWSRVWRKTDERVFDGHDDPLICPLPPGTQARYVRVMLDGRDWFHLDEVEVIGEAAGD